MYLACLHYVRASEFSFIDSLLGFEIRLNLDRIYESKAKHNVLVI